MEIREKNKQYMERRQTVTDPEESNQLADRKRMIEATVLGLPYFEIFNRRLFSILLSSDIVTSRMYAMESRMMTKSGLQYVVSNGIHGSWK